MAKRYKIGTVLVRQSAFGVLILWQQSPPSRGPQNGLADQRKNLPHQARRRRLGTQHRRQDGMRRVHPAQRLRVHVTCPHFVARELHVPASNFIDAQGVRPTSVHKVFDVLKQAL